MHQETAERAHSGGGVMVEPITSIKVETHRHNQHPRFESGGACTLVHE